MIFVFLLIAAVLFLTYGWNRCDLDYMRLLRKHEELQTKYDADIKLMNDRETANREAYRWASARDIQENQRLRVELDALKRQQQPTAHRPQPTVCPPHPNSTGITPP